MARTYRRNKKTTIQRWIGSLEEALDDPSFLSWRYRDPNLTVEEKYARSKARFTRDHHSGHYGVPRWFRRQHGSKPMRMRENHALYTAQVEDAWDNHSADSRCRNGKWYWW